jgi:two-component system sensor histidine kinase QseC
MTHLVEQLLTLARVDPALGGEEFERLDLAELAQQVCSELAPGAIARDQHLALEGEGGVVLGNRVWLGVMLRNLVDNALRYTPEGGRVLVRVGREDGRVRLSVADDGPGLAAAERSSVLARFARGDAAKEEGCGLGLSIVLRVVEAHGGSFAFEDGLERAGGCGLSAVLRLPAAG